MLRLVVYYSLVKPWSFFGVYGFQASMPDLINFVLILGGLAAAAAVGVMCIVVLFVWMAGGAQKDRSEAWRPVDES
jgi:hypothetical protein